MRVLQILPELNVGGVERGVIDLARAFKARGEEIQVISNGGSLVEELVKLGVPHYTLPVHRKSIFSLGLVKEIAKIIERERIDIIHARSRVPAWLAYLATRRTNCDFVTTCHGYYSKHFLSRVMGWGKRVIVISHSIGRRMIDDFHVSPERIRLIHRGVDLSQYQFSPEKYLRPVRDKYRIVNIGRITPIKGQKEFIQGIHMLSKQIPNIEAWIVGAPDEGKARYWNELLLLVERLGLTNQVKFLGTRRDIPDLLREADLLVLSTKIPEAFGRVIAEAGAVGTAAVASRIGGILDVIDEGKNGLLFYPLNVEEMVKCMAELLRDRKRCHEFACRLREKVEREFSLDKMVDETIKVYRETRQEKRILITKFGAAGDLVLAVPSFRMIRKRYPKAKISLVVDSNLALIVENCPYLDEIITFNRSQKSQQWVRLMKLAKRLRESGFDLSIDLQNNAKTHALCFLSRIPHRVGYARGLSGMLLSHPVREPKGVLAPVEHQFELLKRIGVNHFEDEMELWPGEEPEKKVAALLEGAGVEPEERLVGLAVGSSQNWHTKRWPIENFTALAGRIIQELRCRVVLIGGQDESGLAAHFQEHIASGKVINLIGKTSLPDLGSLIKRFAVLVSGDSAPIHLAAAFKTKLVALFGPTEPKRHLPPGNDHAVLVRRMPCQPCYRGTCHNAIQLDCLKKIRVEDVFAAVRRQWMPASFKKTQEIPAAHPLESPENA